MRHSHHHSLICNATGGAVVVALILIIAKFYAWFLSGSLTIQASLFDSLSDFISSLINFCAVLYARRPANEQFRFGHGKAEALAGLIQALLITASAGWIISHAFTAHHSIDLQQQSRVLIIMGACSSLTLGLVLFQYYTIKKTKSIIVKTDFLHYKTDLLSDFAAFTAIFAAQYGFIWLDTVFSMIIAGFLFFGSIGILKQSFYILMDRQLPVAQLKNLTRVIQSHPKIKDIHDLRTRTNGHQDFVQVHIGLDPNLNLADAHAIGDEVEALLKEKHSNLEVLIHLDPHYENQVT